jgi:hypothetical protein
MLLFLAGVRLLEVDGYMPKMRRVIRPYIEPTSRLKNYRINFYNQKCLVAELLGRRLSCNEAKF